MVDGTAKKTPAKRIPPGSIQLQFAGEVILAKNPDRKLVGLFRRYDALFEAFANMTKQDRLLNYKFLNALMLTSLAKKSTDQAQKKQLFDLKNELFLDIANDKALRKKIKFRYLISRNFRVIAFCDACTEKNTKNNIDKHLWKFCPKCNVDRNFYNVLAIHHEFKDGTATLFLSNDQIKKVQNLPTQLPKGRLEDVKEEATFQRYQYNIKNLDAFATESVLKMHSKLKSLA